MADVNLWQTALVSLASALVGGSFVHFLSLKREKTSKRRDIVVKYKMDLWRLIDKSNGLAAETASSEEFDPFNWEEISREIQLLGTDKQIAMVKEIASAMGTNVEVPFVPLMKSLQDELRQELGMKQAAVPYFWIRIKKAAQDKLKITS